MGYALVIRSRSAEKPLAEELVAARLDEAAVTGVPQAPPALQAAPTASPMSPAAVLPAPAPAPAAAAPADTAKPTQGPWTLRNDRARIEARLSRDSSFRGADFEIPFGGAEDELRRAFQFIVRLADSQGATVFDPQLAREVGLGAEEDVVVRWRRSQDWAVDIAGAVEDNRSMQAIVPPPPLLSRRNKVLLLIAGGFILVYWIVSSIADLLR